MIILTPGDAILLDARGPVFHFWGLDMSNRLLTCCCVLALAVFVLAPAALADARLTWPLTGSDTDCSRPSITSSPSSYYLCMCSVTAWEEEGTGVWSKYEGFACAGSAGGARLNHRAHGPGSRPEVGTLLDESYILAFVRGDSLVIREGDGNANWTTVAVAYLGAPADVVGRIDLWCSPYPAYADLAWLTVWSGSHTGGGVRFMQRTDFGWDALETVPTADSELYGGSFPQVTEYGGPSAPQPRIYYNDMDPEPCLKYVDWQFGGGWTEPVPYFGEYVFGSEFDVARTADGYVFLSTGLQPACPCNFISFTEWTEAWGWSASIDMTVHVDHYDWPLSPQIGVDWLGRVHAFWFQLGSDPMMEPHTKRLYYRVRQDDVWEDRSDHLAEQQDMGLDEHLSMSMDGCGEAALAWARRDTVESIPQVKLIWHSYHNYCGLDAGDGPPAALRVTAAPNPFNPAVVIAAAGGHAVVAVEIFDARGRRVANLSPSSSAGRWRARWDGCDASGREQPSGAYLARVRDETGAVASCKIVLAR